MFTYRDRSRSDSDTVLAGVVNAAVGNILNDVEVVALNNANVQAPIQVVCVTDSLNNNHLEILKNILVSVDVIDDVTVNNVSVLNGTSVNVLSFDAGGNTLYVAPTTLAQLAAVRSHRRRLMTEAPG